MIFLVKCYLEFPVIACIAQCQKLLSWIPRTLQCRGCHCKFEVILYVCRLPSYKYFLFEFRTFDPDLFDFGLCRHLEYAGSVCIAQYREHTNWNQRPRKYGGSCWNYYVIMLHGVIDYRAEIRWGQSWQWVTFCDPWPMWSIGLVTHDPLTHDPLYPSWILGHLSSTI